MPQAAAELEFGDLEPQQILHSMRLFAEEVIPTFR
jgi:hypothetical protein